MPGNPIPLRPSAPDCQVPCGLPEEAAARAAADSRIEERLAVMGEQLSEIARASKGARLYLRALLALAIAAAAKWAPGVLQTALDLLSN